MSGGTDVGRPGGRPDRAVSEPVWSWLEAHGRRFGHIVGGAATEPAAGPVLLTMSPWDDQPLASVRRGTTDDVDAAVSAARAALPGWVALGSAGRARHLDAVARAVAADADLLAVLQALDAGVPVRTARQVDVPESLAVLRHHAALAAIADAEPRADDEPGVAGYLLSWAGPLRVLVRSVAPALARGHTVAAKPSGHTPLTALRLAELCRDAGLPPGVLNVVTGGDETGKALAAHPDLDAVALVGSREAARAVRRATAGSGATVTAEVAATATFLVFEDADLDAAADGVVHALTTGYGSPWRAGARILAQEGVVELLESRLRARMAGLRVGDPLDPSMDLGAAAPPGPGARLDEALDEAGAGGASVWRPHDAAPRPGWFRAPVLCTGPAPSAVLGHDPLPGPVAVLDSFRTPDEAMARAGRGRTRVSVSVWTRAIDVAHDAAEGLQADVTWINDAPRPVPTLAPLRWVGGRAHPRRADGGRRGPDPAAGAGSAASAHAPATYAPDRAAPPDEVDVLVAAARAAQPAWGLRPARDRASVLGGLAHGLAARRTDVARWLAVAPDGAPDDGADEVDRAVARLRSVGARAETWEGRFRRTPDGAVALVGRAPLGVVVAVAPTSPVLAGLVSVLAPLTVAGNAIVLVPPPGLVDGDGTGLLAALLDGSGMPRGVVTIWSGPAASGIPALARRPDVDAVWYFGPADGVAEVERASAAHLTPTWAPPADGRAWTDDDPATDRALLRAAGRPVTVWLPGGA